MEGNQQQVRTISKKRKFVADGVFQAELNDFLQRALQQDGYAGIEVIVTSVNTEVRIKATRISEVLGKYGRRIRELTSLVQKRFNYPKDAIELLAQKVVKRGLCASVQAESLRYKLLGSVPVRMAANSIVRQVMLAGAKGVEVTVSGKLRAQRAKTMKFRDGYMISTGQPKDIFVDESVRHVNLRQGTLGVKVKILLPHDPTGAFGPKQRMPDNVDIVEPKEYVAVGNL